MLPLKDKRILITGGTGSLGQVLVRRLLTGEMGRPSEDHRVLARRGETARHAGRVPAQARRHRRGHLPQLRGDCSSSASATCATSTTSPRRCATPTWCSTRRRSSRCRPASTSRSRRCTTNIAGPENIVRAIQEHELPVETVVGISTDKACKPVNVMGMTKAIQERVFIQGNMRCPQDAVHLRALRQRARLARLGDPALPRPDPQRRPGDHHDRPT